MQSLIPKVLLVSKKRLVNLYFYFQIFILCFDLLLLFQNVIAFIFYIIESFIITFVSP